MTQGVRFPTMAFITGGAGQADDGIPPQPFETFCYDSALMQAKIENFNVVPYTSVLPKEIKGNIVPLTDDIIKQVKESVNIPVFGNGDIKTVDDAIKMIEYTGVDGVMVARGTFGNPWLVRDLVDYFEGRPIKTPPTKEEKIAMLKHHFEELLKIKCEKLAVLEMRTLAAWYVKGFSNAKEFKNKLIYVKTKEELFELIENL